MTGNAMFANAAGPETRTQEKEKPFVSPCVPDVSCIPDAPCSSGPLPPALSERLEREKIDALAEFAAGIGHELNNPLAIINGHAQLMLRESDDPARRRSLATMIAQVRRAYEMIADIRLFARPPQPEVETCELVALLRSAVGTESSFVEEGDITFVLHVESPELSVVSDPVQLRVVLGALLKNAREAMRRGTVRVTCGRDAENRPFFAVEDDGPGIPEDVRPLIFCPYFSGRQAGRGLGFGLAKAWRIMQQLGGTIRVEPVRPHGSRFIVVLPAA